MQNCLREGYLSRSAKVAATISLLDVMWSQFWFRRGIETIGRWRFFGWLVKGRRKPHQERSTLSWYDRQSWWAHGNIRKVKSETVRLWWATGHNHDLGPTRSLRENPNRKWLSENLALVIFWKSGCFLCFFNLPFLPAKHMNHTIQFAFKIIVSHQEKQEFEVSNKQSRTSKQAPTRDCLRSPSHIILRICLRRTYAPSGITHEWCEFLSNLNSIIWRKKTWLSWDPATQRDPKLPPSIQKLFRKKTGLIASILKDQLLPQKTSKNHDYQWFTFLLSQKSRGMWSGKCSQDQKLAKETRTHTQKHNCNSIVWFTLSLHKNNLYLRI